MDTPPSTPPPLASYDVDKTTTTTTMASSSSSPGCVVPPPPAAIITAGGRLASAAAAPSTPDHHRHHRRHDDRDIIEDADGMTEEDERVDEDEGDDDDDDYNYDYDHDYVCHDANETTTSTNTTSCPYSTPGRGGASSSSSSFGHRHHSHREGDDDDNDHHRRHRRMPSSDLTPVIRNYSSSLIASDDVVRPPMSHPFPVSSMAGGVAMPSEEEDGSTGGGGGVGPGPGPGPGPPLPRARRGSRMPLPRAAPRPSPPSPPIVAGGGGEGTAAAAAAASSSVVAVDDPHPPPHHGDDREPSSSSSSGIANHVLVVGSRAATTDATTTTKTSVPSPADDVARPLCAPFDLPQRASRGATASYDDRRRQRAFSSFQGAGQYRRRAAAASSRDDDVGRQRATWTPATGYRPPQRDVHGVTEMAEPGDLMAIFKAPRGKRGGVGGGGETSSSASASAFVVPTADGGGGPNVVSPSSAVGPLSPSSAAGKEEEEEEEDPSGRHIPRAPYPVEDRQWSIPSIRLANHVGSSGMLYRGQNVGSCATFQSEYTDEEGMSLDESYYSFLADDDDDDDTASLSSRGSLGAPGERRRFSRQHLLRMSSSGTHDGIMDGAAAFDEGRGIANGVFLPFQHPAPSAFPVPVFGRTNSFLEKMRGISIEGGTSVDDRVAEAPPSPPPLPRRARTFDHESPPPVLNVDVDMTEDDAAVDYYHDGENVDGIVPPSYSGGGVVRTRQSSSGRRRQRRRRHRKEGAAVEWIQDLQSRSNDFRPIAESASSRFLTGDNPLQPPTGVGASGPDGPDPTRTNVGLTQEEIAKVLGMPHPLCRSSTIEAGPFTLGIHRGGGPYLRSGNDDVVPCGVNNSIALTSSGSGD